MTVDSALHRALLAQSRGCQAGGSPLNAAILVKAASDWALGGPVRSLMAPWSELDYAAQLDAATPIRLIGALHELALSGDDPKLSVAYTKGDAEAVWAAAQPAMLRHQDRLAAFMGHEPQTNEVRRSVCLVGGFLEIAAKTALPLRCFEIGASAGLNSSWNRYRYRLGDVHWGDPSASLTLDADWTGPPPTVSGSSNARPAIVGPPTFMIPISGGGCWPMSGPTNPNGWPAPAPPSMMRWRTASQ